ncbi:unnamed protein product [Arabidopsis halleri]
MTCFKTTMNKVLFLCLSILFCWQLAIDAIWFSYLENFGTCFSLSKFMRSRTCFRQQEGEMLDL